MDTETEGEHRLLYGQDDSSALTNDDAVSLFSTSLTKALEKQNSVIVNSIVQQIAKSSASTPRQRNSIPDALHWDGDRFVLLKVDCSQSGCRHFLKKICIIIRPLCC